MLGEPVCLQIHVRLEHHKLLLHALPIRAQVMILAEMLLQGVVVLVVMRLSRIPPVADEAPLVLHAAVLVQLVVVVEPLPAERAQGVAFESRLVRAAGLVISVAHVLLEGLLRK